jgi:1,6-anhydro-N-acetylmuramate kinase
MAWTIGLMSGTSLDGVDGVLAWGPPGASLVARQHQHLPFYILKHVFQRSSFYPLVK